MTTLIQSLLPSFLSPLPSQPESLSYIQSVFQHTSVLGTSHTLWWPNSNLESEPDCVALFIPGNPGLVEFYIPFLSAVHRDAKDRNLAILAHSHLGHTPNVPAIEYGLVAQIEAVIEALDAVKRSYQNARIILMGHSVGAWIALQVLKARSEATHSTLLLFPTIRNIAHTPAGRSLHWAFRPPLPFIISKVSVLLRLFPRFILNTVYREWPDHQLDVLVGLLRSSSSIFACLSMAHDEMKMIRELDLEVLEQHKHHIHMFFAEKDAWVGNQKNAILKSLNPDYDSVRIVHGAQGIPHAFCINHGEELADQCIEWLFR